MAPDGMQRRRSTPVLLVKSTKGGRIVTQNHPWDSSLGLALCVLIFFCVPAVEDLE